MDNVHVLRQGGGGAPPADADPGRRPPLVFEESDLPRLVDEACAHLIDQDRQVYARGTSLFRPVRLAGAGGSKNILRRDGATILVPVDETALIEVLTTAIDWRKPNRNGDKFKPISAPPAIAKTILSRRGDWPFPQLVAVVSAPTLRADFSIINEPGFDHASGVYFEPGDAVWPKIKDRPTRHDAEAALATLSDLLVDFPFVTPADRSGALAMMLTALVRPALPTAPLFGVSAPVPGSGKSKIVDLAAILATGRNAAVMSAPREEDELRKSIGAALMAGDPILNIDNVEHALRSEYLCQVLTQEQVKTRVLGQSLNMDLPTSATFAATGNGLRFAGDLTRRVVLISLDPGTERPEERVFDRDILAFAKLNRVALVCAGLTLLRAFVTFRGDRVKPALGSFEAWSDLIRSALVWVGEADPLANAERVREDDPERERTRGIIHALPAGKWVSSEVVEMVRHDLGRSPEFREQQALTEALGDMIQRGHLDGQRFALFLRKHRDRIVDGRRIVKAGERNRAALWAIEAIEGRREPTEGSW